MVSVWLFYIETVFLLLLLLFLALAMYFSGRNSLKTDLLNLQPKRDQLLRFFGVEKQRNRHSLCAVSSLERETRRNWRQVHQRAAITTRQRAFGLK